MHSTPPIPPFGRSVERLSILGLPVADWRARLLRDHQFDPEPHEGRYRRADGLSLSWSPEVWVSPDYLQAFVDRAARAESPVVAEVELSTPHLAFGRNRSTYSAQAGERVRYALEASSAAAEGREAVPFQIPWSGVHNKVRQPGRLTEPLIMPLEPELIWSVRHWCDVLACNMMMLAVAVDRMPEASERGTDCHVHPTATVERTRLGNGVRIGPYAYVSGSTVGNDVVIGNHGSVLGSWVGDGVLVQEYASVKDSVVGAGAVVSFRTSVRTSVLFGACTSSAPVVPRSVVGEDSFLSRGLAIAASALDGGPVWVWHRGRRIDTGMPLLGVAIGPGARLGNVSLPAGYEVPEGYYLAGRSVARVAPNLPQRQTLVETNGTFRRFGGPFDTKRDDP